MAPKRAPKAKVFSYTRQQVQAIWKHLKSAGIQEGITKEEVINQITPAAQYALMQKSPPYAGTIRTELRNLSTSIDKFLKTFTLSPTSQSVLEAYYQELYEPAKRAEFIAKLGITQTQLFLRTLLETLKEGLDSQAKGLQPKTTRTALVPQLEKEVFDNLPAEVLEIIERSRKTKSNVSLGLPHRGAPIDIRQKSFGYSLCAIFFEATGRLPKVGYSNEKEEPSGPFFHFATAAIHPTGLFQDGKSPVALLKKVSKDYSPPTPTRRSQQAEPPPSSLRNESF